MSKLTSDRDPQHGEGCHGPEPEHQPVVSVQANEDIAKRGPEHKFGYQALHGGQGHEEAQQGCWCDQHG